METLLELIPAALLMVGIITVSVFIYLGAVYLAKGIVDLMRHKEE